MNDFDLLGKKRNNARDFNQTMAMTCGTIFLAVCFGFIFWFGYEYIATNKLRHAYKKSLELMNQLETAHKQHQAASTTQQFLKEQQAVQFHNKQCAFYPMLNKLTNLLPYDVRLTVITFTEQQKLELRGETLSAKSLTNFVNSLKMKPCFEKCALEGMSKKQTKDRAYFDFTIKVNLTEDHGQNKKIGAR